MIQELRQEHDLAILLEIAQLPKATYYYHRKKQESTDKYARVKAEIQSIFHENKGRYGYRRITDELRNRGLGLNHKTVQRLMKELGLVCRARMKKYRPYKGEVGKIADNKLNREFCAEKPNQKWVTDVTQFRKDTQFIYSAVTTAWLYLTPIFYPLEALPAHLIWCIKHLNPMYFYIGQFRDLVYYGRMPVHLIILTGCGAAVIMLALGMWRFMRSKDRFILYI